MKYFAKVFEQLNAPSRRSDYVKNAAKILYEFHMIADGQSKSVELWESDVEAMLKLKGEEGVSIMLFKCEQACCEVAGYEKIKMPRL